MNAQGNLTKVYFNKPFYSKYLTVDIKKHLVRTNLPIPPPHPLRDQIYNADRDSDNERLLFLVCHTQFYEE